MHRFRSWTLDPPEYRTQRNRLLPIEGGDGSTLNLDFTTGVLDPRLTFTRASGGTYVANDGYIYGMDFATSSSLAIGTGSKSVTLTATASVDRRYLVGQTVYISNGANNMSGPVTAYNASTQVLTINATATSGSGSFTSWSVGNASPRFDYDPTSIGTPRGLLIEGSATNLLNWSESFATSGGTNNNWADNNLTRNSTNNTDPANGTTALRVTASGAGNGTIISTAAIGTSAQRTFSIWLRRVSGTGDIQYTLDNGSTYTTQAITSSWVRYTFAATTANQRVGIRIVNSGESIELWGAQLEAGPIASSYIPTGASQGTRARDECSITGNSFSSWFTNPNEGSFFVQYSMNYPSASMGAGIDRYAFEISDSAGLSRALCIAAYRNAPVGRNVRVFNPSVASFDSGDTLTTSSALNTKFAFGYATANNYIAAVGVAQAFQTYNTGSLPTSPAINQMWLGTNRNLSSTTYLFGCIRTIKYWPTRLPNATLQGLVS